MGHALMENRNGLIVGAVTTRASGHAKRLAALALIEPHAERPQPVTLRADNGDDGGFVIELRDKAVTPHVAQNTSARRSTIDGHGTRHPGYAISQRIRKRFEETFGWAKQWPAGLRKMRHRGLRKVDWQFTLVMAAYDLFRHPNCFPGLFCDQALTIKAVHAHSPPDRQSITAKRRATANEHCGSQSALKFAIFQHSPG